MKNTKRINSSEISGSDSDQTAHCHENNLVEEKRASSYNSKGSKAKKPNKYESTIIFKPKIFAANSKNNADHYATTIVSDQKVGLRPCTSLSPLDEFSGDLRFICSRLFNASVEKIFKHQIDEMKISHARTIDSSLLQTQKMATNSTINALTDEEDDCVTPKDRKILSKPVDVVEIDQNKDQNDNQIEVLNENQTGDQSDTSIISQGKILSGKLQLYCKSALNKSLDSIAKLTSVIKKSATMTNHLQISDGIDEEDQSNDNVTDTIMIPEISDNISDISSTDLSICYSNPGPAIESFERINNLEQTQITPACNKIGLDSRVSLNRAGIFNIYKPKIKVFKGNLRFDKILSWVKNFKRLENRKNVDQIDNSLIQWPEQKRCRTPLSSLQSFEYDDQLIIHPTVYRDQTFLEENNQKKLFFQEISKIISICVEKNYSFNEEIDLGRYIMNFEELNFDVIQNFVRFLIKEVNDKNSYFSHQMKLKQIYKDLLNREDMRNTVLMLENHDLQETRITQYKTIHNLSAALFEFMNNLKESQTDQNSSCQNEISICDEANVLINIFSSMNKIVTQNKELKEKLNQKTHEYESIQKMYEETNNLNDLISKNAQYVQIDEVISREADIKHLRSKIKDLEALNLELVEENQKQIACVEKEKDILNETNGNYIIKINEFQERIKNLCIQIEDQQLTIDRDLKENVEKLKWQEIEFDKIILKNKTDMDKKILEVINSWKNESLKEKEKNNKNLTDQKENYEKIILNLQTNATLATNHTDQNKSQARFLQEQVQKLQTAQSSNILQITQYSEKIRSLEEEIYTSGELLKEQKKESRKTKMNFEKEIKKNEEIYQKKLCSTKTEYDSYINNLNIEIGLQKDLQLSHKREIDEIIAKNIQDINAQSIQNLNKLDELQDQKNKSIEEKVKLIEKLKIEFNSAKKENEDLKKQLDQNLTQINGSSASILISNDQIEIPKSSIYIVGASENQNGLFSKKVGLCGISGCNGTGNSNGFSKTHRTVTSCPNNKKKIQRKKLDTNLLKLIRSKNKDQSMLNLENKRTKLNLTETITNLDLSYVKIGELETNEIFLKNEIEHLMKELDQIKQIRSTEGKSSKENQLFSEILNLKQVISEHRSKEFNMSHNFDTLTNSENLLRNENINLKELLSKYEIEIHNLQLNKLNITIGYTDEIARIKKFSTELLDYIEQQKLTITQDTEIKKDLQIKIDNYDRLASDSLLKNQTTELDLRNLKNLYTNLKQTTDQKIESLEKKNEESNIQQDATFNEYFDELIEENKHLSEKIVNLERNQKYNYPKYTPQVQREREFDSNQFKRTNDDSRISNIKRKITDGFYNDSRSNDQFFGIYNSRGNANGRPVYLGPNDGLYYVNKYNHFSYLSSDKKNSNNIKF